MGISGLERAESTSERFWRWFWDIGSFFTVAALAWAIAE